MIKLSIVGIDGWDRLVLKGDNGRFYKTTELLSTLVPNGGFMALPEEEQLSKLHSLHSTDGFDGEPDFPCWEEGKFSILQTLSSRTDEKNN